MFEPIEGDKQCARCQQRKPLSQFSPRSDRPGRRHPTCKACRNQEAKDRAVLGRRKDRAHCEELYPRRLRESLLDVRARRWRYPVERGPLAPNLGMSVPGLEMAA